jgi:hypothetical protein
MKDAALREAIQAMRKVGHAPIAAYMRDKGCSPEAGFWLVLPKSCEKVNPGQYGWPGYVRISAILTLPCLVKALEGDEKAPGVHKDGFSPELGSGIEGGGGNGAQNGSQAVPMPEGEARARSTDPETSHESAKVVNFTARLAKVLLVYEGGKAMTMFQAQELLPYRIQNMSNVFCKLERDGKWLVKIGKAPGACAGAWRGIYQITDKGREALRQARVKRWFE